VYERERGGERGGGREFGESWLVMSREMRGV
jgi:hypothetical protein